METEYKKSLYVEGEGPTTIIVQNVFSVYPDTYYIKIYQTYLLQL